MRKEIIALLSQKENMSLEMEKIAKALEVKDKGLLQEELNALVREGILDYSSKKSKYLLFENSHLYKGRVVLDKLGNGIVEVNGNKVHILKKNLRGATYHDLVAIEVNEAMNYGNVVRILERDNSHYVGEVIVKNGKLYIQDKRLGLVEIDNNKSGLVEGHRVLIHHNNGRNAVVKVIGHKDDPNVDILSILYDHGFNDAFSDGVLDELKDVPSYLTKEVIEEELKNGRIDFRNKKVVTMDCDDTKDIDDAISIERLSDGTIELGVYIADVSHYIKKGSCLDREAFDRGTSVYPPGSVCPQFPHQISNGICSINPGVDRLAMCYLMRFDDHGRVIDFDVKEGIIHSSKKMTYSDVNRILEDNENLPGYEDYKKELYLMQKLSLLIEKQLIALGYLKFDMPEGKVILDEIYQVVDISKREQRTAEKIIEYFMLITNIELTKYAEYLGLPWIYRVHGMPDQDKLDKVMGILKLNRYIDSNDKKKKYYSSDLQKVINSLSKKDNAEVFYKMLIVSQDKAKYSVENIGHYALGVGDYSHNTSPIRRLPDLLNQRILKSFLHYGIEKTVDLYGTDDLYDDALHCSRQERAAEMVEREAVAMKKAEYMERHIGDVYTGVISYVCDYGFWVLLENTVEGFVSVNELPRDNYSYVEERGMLQGKYQSYGIGDFVEVRVKGTNKEARTVDFTVKVKEIEKDEKKGKKNYKKKVKTR